MAGQMAAPPGPLTVMQSNGTGYPLYPLPPPGHPLPPPPSMLPMAGAVVVLGQVRGSCKHAFIPHGGGN